jgi:hypothetical protein
VCLVPFGTVKPVNGKKTQPTPKSSNFNIHPTTTQKHKEKIKPNPPNNIIDPQTNP